MVKNSFLILSEFIVERAQENGGNITFSNYDSLEQTFSKEVGPHIAQYMGHVMIKSVYAICEQQRCRSACSSTQSDQRLCC